MTPRRVTSCSTFVPPPTSGCARSCSPHASLARQFDEYVWFDESRALTPLTEEPGRVPAQTFPFGL